MCRSRCKAYNHERYEPFTSSEMPLTEAKDTVKRCKSEYMKKKDKNKEKTISQVMQEIKKARKKKKHAPSNRP